MPDQRNLYQDYKRSGQLDTLYDHNMPMLREVLHWLTMWQFIFVHLPLHAWCGPAPVYCIYVSSLLSLVDKMFTLPHTEIWLSGYVADENSLSQFTQQHDMQRVGSHKGLEFSENRCDFVSQFIAFVSGNIIYFMLIVSF